MPFHAESIVTGAQIRSARAALGWSAQTLADKIWGRPSNAYALGTNRRRAEQPLVNVGSNKKRSRIAGIEFIGSPTDGPGIRIRTLSTRSK